MRASEGNMLFKSVTAIYYISWIFIGNFILLNLFLAILIDGFNEQDEEDAEEEDEEVLAAEEKIRKEKLKEEKERRFKKLGTSKA